ncbi:hypothetical protein XENOCAPTIV_027641 [Xenoophorus captivus]|uniref:Uncharacterized protein n=1 Tax=Xenoophorus captivus TaxID=1517983 RepID=A0ABV0RT05_9TELE
MNLIVGLCFKYEVVICPSGGAGKGKNRQIANCETSGNVEANLSATTVVTPAKCALGHWPTYTHYCWRTEPKRAPALCHGSTILSSPDCLLASFFNVGPSLCQGCLFF